MTPAQEAALIAATAAGLDDELRDGFRELLELIAAGVVPRDAVQAVISSFAGSMAETMAVAFSAILEIRMGSESVLGLQVGMVSLSRRLWAEAQNVASDVEGIVDRHSRGLLDARKLALELFEGYGFRDPTAEPLRISPRNPALPQYLREALLTDDQVRAVLARAYARLQVDGLSTDALRAAYSGVLDAIDGLAVGQGRELLEKRLEVAFYERMRYFASRIARTELHRAYSDREARLLMADEDLAFIQIRRAPGRGAPCICSIFAGRDLYGLGSGVYPKAQAPRPPFHPFCQCVLAPRLDLTGRRAGERDAEGDAYFLRRVGETTAGRIMGSAGNADAVRRGVAVEDIVNARRDPMYQVRTVGG